MVYHSPYPTCSHVSLVWDRSRGRQSRSWKSKNEQTLTWQFKYTSLAKFHQSHIGIYDSIICDIFVSFHVQLAALIFREKGKEGTYVCCLSLQLVISIKRHNNHVPFHFSWWHHVASCAYRFMWKDKCKPAYGAPCLYGIIIICYYGNQIHSNHHQFTTGKKRNLS